MADWQGNVSVILVETRKAGNIGSAARAMHNTGFERLKLVAPREPVNDECRMMAANSFEIVENSLGFADFDEAVADEQLLVGTTSSRGRRSRRRHHTPGELAPLLIERAATERVALVFGPERRGLSEHQLARCHYLVSIPAAQAAPTYNLAQSVLLLCYSLLIGAGRDAAPTPPRLAPEAERAAMFDHMQQVLVDIGFLSQSNPDHIMDSIRHFLGRAELSSRDVQILRGIMSQMEWYVQSGSKLDPDRVKKP